MRFIAALYIALAGALSAPAMAQDIPGRVGRIAYIEGSAAVYADPDEGWEKAYVNSPLTSENSVWTDPGARAELRVGGTAVRLDQATQLDIARLDEETFEAFVPRGTVAVRVRHYERGRDLVVETPHARFSLRADGRYRIDVDPDVDESRITVFAGDASVGSDSGPVRAKAGQTVRVFGGASSSYVVEKAFSDPFDTWATQRDARWVETRSVQYVSPDMTGYEDLDSYGNWSQDPDYGAVWYPTRVASDWAPYRYGRWDYVRPWGWTWVDDSAWGYAPFHYGRWVNVRNRWAWYPGKREARPVWAPALVAWIGGSSFSVGASSPSVGWYPLSPHDRYQPWYKASPTYINQVNVVVNNFPQRQQNAQIRDYNRNHGATVVNRQAVVDRRPVQQSRVNVRPEMLAAAAVTTAAAVLPARNEVVQRRVAQRTQDAAKQPAGPAPRPGQPTVAGPNNNPAARPEFTRKPAVANATPQPAKAAPPPARRVSAPLAPHERGTPTPATTPAPAREAQQQAREAQQKQQQERAAQQQQQQQSREQQAREAQQKQQSREQQTREAQQKQQQDRAAQQQQLQQQTREAQQKQQQSREQQTREAQQKQQQSREQQAREAQQKQQQAREAQQKQQQDRAAQQQQLQQQTREAQQKQQQSREQQAREAQQKQQQAREAQQKQQQDRAAQQQQQSQAREAQQKQQQERAAQQQQQAQQRQQQQQQQQQQAQERAQRAPQPVPSRTREEQNAKDKKDKDDDDKKKGGR